MKDFDIRTLKILTPPNLQPHLIEYLTCPYRSPWGGLDATAFETAFLSLKAILDPDLVRLLELWLTVHVLKEGDGAPAWVVPFVRTHIPVDRHLPSTSWDAPAAGRWTVVASAMVKGEHRQLRYFMAGRMAGLQSLELLPSWAEKVLDKVSRQALGAAALAALERCRNPGGDTLCVFPLAPPQDGCRLQGASLGLPAALAFMTVLTGEKASRRYLATGALQGAGAVGFVEGVADKRRLASDDDRYSLFLYPEENAPVPGDEAIDTLPVSDLDEAWSAVRRHAPGNGGELLAFTRMMKTPEAFVAGMARVDASWVAYEARRGRCRDIVRKVIGLPAHFAGFIARIDRMLDTWALDDAETFLDLCTPEDLTSAAGHAPLSVFRCCIQQIALANHRGDVASAQTWADRAEALLEVVRRADLNLCADFFNHCFVTRHNQYRFDPEFPDNLGRVLEILERRHAVQCGGGCPTDPVLASLYGTVAQNFGFCGPEFLTQACDYASKAAAAFGGGAVPEFRQDGLRQQSYLCHAFLDTGDYPRAEKSLVAFVEADGWPDIMNRCRDGRMSAWHHAALARFFADTGETEKSPDYLRWCTERRADFSGGDHPRQLWAFNVGRIAAAVQPKAAAAWFESSLALCLEKEKQPTIHAMALLPLSGLRHLGILEESCPPETVSKVIRSALALNGSHFRQLESSDRDSLLKNIWKHPRALFPFTYR